MNKNFNLLLIEGSGEHIMPFINHLQKEGFRPAFKRVESRSDFMNAVQEQEWDIIVTCCTQPAFDEYAALKALKETQLDIPLIVVSENMDEERAGQLMRAGAKDYLAKNQLSRFAPIIERELSEIRLRRERNKTFEDLKNREYFIQQITEMVPLTIYIFDLEEQKNVYSNRSIFNLLGYTPKQIQEMGSNLFANILHPDDLPTVNEQRAMINQAADGQSVEVTYRMKDASGNWHWLHSWDVVFLRDEQGKPRQILGVAEDITEQKHNEAEILRLASFPKTNPMPIIEFDMQGEITFANAAATQLGISGEGNIIQLIPDDFPEIQQDLAQNKSTHRIREIEMNARVYEAHIFLAPQFHAARIYAMDISERKQAENALLERSRIAELGADVGRALILKDSLPNILQQCAAAIVRNLDAAIASIWTFNQAEQILELKASYGMYTNLDGRHSRIPIGQYIIGYIAQQRKTYLSNSLAGDPLISDQEWVKQEGMVAFAGFPLVVEDQLVGVVAMFAQKMLTDFALKALDSVANQIALGIEQKHSEEAVRALAQQWQSTFDSVTDVVLLLDTNSVIQRCNRAALRFVNQDDPAQLIGRRCHEVFHGVLQPLKHCPVFRMKETLKREFLELQVSERWYNFTVDPIFDPARELIGSVHIIRDIDSQKRLQEENNKLATLVEQSTESILITDCQAKIIYVNPAFEKITGYLREDVIGLNPRFLKSGEHDNDFYQVLWDRLSKGKEWTGKFINRKKDGTFFYEIALIFPIKDVQGNIINYAAVKRDITEEQKLQEQILQNQKLDSLGQLTGGVAHDFNNLLTVINGYSQLGLETLDSNHPLYHQLSQIHQAGERAANLTSQLLAFSRKQIIYPKIISLNKIIENLAKMLNRLIGEDISIEMDLSPSLLPILADPAQIDQIIINLAVNARDAIHSKRVSTMEKKITIETSVVSVDEEFVRRHLGIKAGCFVLLTIGDTGSGMDENVRRKIFEPFFTTKLLGKGTGLGLATVYGIVKQNEGFIYVDSEPGVGATFRIYWPCAAEKVDELSDRKIMGSARGKNETILIVEDEDPVRMFVVNALRHLGYQTIEAANGVEAMEVLKKHQQPIHLVITDVVMPFMNGKELANQILQLYPSIKMLFASGYTNDQILPTGIFNQEASFIQKPYSLETLSKKIRETIDS